MPTKIFFFFFFFFFFLIFLSYKGGLGTLFKLSEFYLKFDLQIYYGRISALDSCACKGAAVCYNVGNPFILHYRYICTRPE